MVIAYLDILLALVPALLHAFILCGRSSSPSVLLSDSDLGSTAPNNEVTPGCDVVVVVVPPEFPPVVEVLVALLVVLVEVLVGGINVIHGLKCLPCILMALLDIGLMFSLCGLLERPLTKLWVMVIASLLGVTALGRDVCPGPFLVLRRLTLLRHGLQWLMCMRRLLLTLTAPTVCVLTLLSRVIRRRRFLRVLLVPWVVFLLELKQKRAS